jgi:hypothetical protein
MQRGRISSALCFGAASRLMKPGVYTAFLAAAPVLSRLGPSLWCCKPACVIICSSWRPCLCGVLQCLCMSGCAGPTCWGAQHSSFLGGLCCFPTSQHCLLASLLAFRWCWSVVYVCHYQWLCWLCRVPYPDVHRRVQLLTGSQLVASVHATCMLPMLACPTMGFRFCLIA